MTSSKKTTVAIAAGIVILGLVAYFLWLRPSPDDNVSVEGFETLNEAQATFLTLAAQLEPVAFDASILNDPRFLSLVDIKTVIAPEVEGRNDPFGSLPGVR